MKIQNTILFFLLVSLLAFSCKREESTRWEIDGRAPIAGGEIAWEDLIADSLLDVDSEGLLHLIYEQSLVDFGLDTLVEIADTTITNSFDAGFTGGPIDIPAGQSIISLDENINMNVNSAELRRIVVESGVLSYSFKSYVGGPLDIEYTIPGVELGESSFGLTVTSEAGTDDAPWVYTNTVDLSGAIIDLQGTSGNSTNEIATYLSVNASSAAAEPVPVFGDDSVAIDLSFIDVRIAYGQGFFGTIESELDQLIDIEPLSNIGGGQLDLEELSFAIDITNYIGADAQLTLSEIKGVRNENEVELTHTLINDQQNITRAIDNNGTVLPTNYSFLIDETNSNIVPLFELLPEALNIQGDIVINPLGDISGGNDFIYTSQPLEATFVADLPLCVGFQGVFFQDTLEIDSRDEPIVGEGLLHIEAVNSFPLSASITLRFLDDNNEQISLLLENGDVVSSTYDGTSYVPVTSMFDVVVSSEVLAALNNANQLLMEVVLDTEGTELVKMNGEEKIELNITAEGSIQLSYE